MLQYQDMLRHILTKGINKEDRTGTGTRSVFGYQTRYDLNDGFPLVTTKHTFFRGIIVELLWFLRGDSNIRYLLENGVRIWTPWAYKKYQQSGGEKTVRDFEHAIIQDAKFAEMWGDLGPVYGKQWRKWENAEFKPRGTPINTKAACVTWLPTVMNGVEGRYEFSTIDQITNVIERIKEKPDDRRLIVSAWNPAEVDNMALPPCHCLFQFYTRPMTRHQRVDYAMKRGIPVNIFREEATDFMDNANIPTRFLDCQLYQRSADSFIGVPFNIASYALLTHMIAQITNMAPGEFIHTIGDAHIYSNHFDQVALQLTREPLELPTLDLNPEIKNIFDFKVRDIRLGNYNSYPAIKGEVAV